MDNEIYSERRSYQPEKKQSHKILFSIFIIIAGVFASVAAFTYSEKSQNMIPKSEIYHQTKKVEQPTQEPQRVKRKTKAEFQWSNSYHTKEYTASIKNNSKSSTQNRRKESARKINSNTCIYWNSQYQKNPDNYNRLMRNDACKRAGYKIVKASSTPQQQVNYIPHGSDLKNRSNSCHSIQQCRQYQRNFEDIKRAMRRGYQASEYNRLEGKRKHWKESLMKYCNCYSNSDY